MIDWYPLAQRSLVFPGCGPHLHGPYRITLHTTEGQTMSAALSTYQKTGYYPQFTVCEDEIEQHCPLSVGATALEHPQGTPETNRASAIQIEIIGYAENAQNFTPKLLSKLKELCTWIAQQTGVDLTKAAEFKAYPASYGTDNGVRFTAQQWQDFNGIAGHMHVVGNLHGDPGLINIAAILSEEDEMAAQFKISCPTGGYWLVTRATGGVYAEAGAPFFGSMAGKPMNTPVVDLQPCIVNFKVQGYWLAGEDGGVFGFGAAQVPDTYVAHPEWHNGQENRTVVGIRQHDPGYDLLMVEKNTDPPKVDVYDFSQKRPITTTN